MRASAVSVKRGGRAVILAGIAVGMVLVLGLLHWKDLLVRYHLIRLRADPAYLRAATMEPEGSLVRAGLSLYLQTEEGKDRLAREYFDACEDWCDAWIPGTRWEEGTAIFQMKNILGVGGVHGGPVGTGELLRDNERDRFIRSSASFLAWLWGKRFRPEKNPRVEVYFLPADEAGFHAGWFLWVEGGVISIPPARLLRSRPPVGFPMEALAATKAATALLIEPAGDVGIMPVD